MGGRRTEAGHKTRAAESPFLLQRKHMGGMRGSWAGAARDNSPGLGCGGGRGAAHPEVEGPRTRAAEADSHGQTPGKRWFCGLVS